MTELNNTSAPNTESTSTNATSAEVPAFAPVGDEKNFPMTAKEAPISGIIPSKDVPFKDQVAGHAKYYAGLVTRNDSEVQQGAAIVRGDAQAIPKASKDGAAASKES
ncbi:unnamed protein product [Tilletia controversa]|uniref:Uncharacterized protein n=3 Tax=Tilletia TaxID=13289 RepID=A0A8X7MMY3_9BASI|nr:hypothetical protein CF328_g5900 [Tilletia controversa]KAE8254915.1 hypothetical protein A4X03_0g5645 [Tilletia caries]CAD6898862.1 unnamed protein product [Tilletia laevis]KAE8242481.1 hypothetical protein A4X06_0g6888 [Tilletia controversa]CAD6892194.1 unnamed protein product [Tilletia caries]